MEKKRYVLVRSVLDRKGMEIEKSDISGHDTYHDACEALRKAIFKETSNSFKASKTDIFDREGNLKTNSPYIKEWINEYNPYRWRVGGTRNKTIIFEVVRRTF